MIEIYLRRVQSGFMPDSVADGDLAQRFKLGSVVKAEVKVPRNLAFHRKFFALLQVGFDLWEETGIRAEYKGQEVRPDAERFRKDVCILAGFGRPVVNLRGEVRYEAESISFGNMSEERFEALYNAVLATIVNKVMRGRVSEERLRQMVDAVEEFA